MEEQNLKIDWKQKGNKVYFDYRGEAIYFVVPKGFKLKDTHPDLLKLCEWLIFSPWYPDILKGYKFTRKAENGTGLAFSGGVDSTATMMVLPKAKLFYTQRHGINDGVLNQSNHLNFIKKLRKKVEITKTNFELVRTKHGLGLGYSTGLAMGVPMVLLADYYKLGRISYGMIMDSTYFPKGIYRPLTKDFYKRQDYFKSAGLELYFPLLGCSEVITSRIVNDSKYKNLAFSCLRGKEGLSCDNCYKCFRKQLLSRVLTPLDKESFYAISKNPPKMAPSLTYAMNEFPKKYHLKQLQPFSHMHLKLLENVFLEYLKLYEGKTKEEIIQLIYKHKIKPMSPYQLKRFKKLDFRRTE